MNVKSLLSSAFLMAVIESVRSNGPENTASLINKIAISLGEIEGPSLEGDPKGDINCLYICPFANLLQEFLEMYKEIPPEFEDIRSYYECKAVSNFFCIFHHSFRERRAELAGRRVVHIASNANSEGKTAYNDDAISGAGLTKEKVDELLNRVTCIFKFE